MLPEKVAGAPHVNESLSYIHQLAALLKVIMNHVDIWKVAHPPTPPHPYAKINVFVVHEEILIKKARILKRKPAYQHARTHEPVDFRKAGVVPVGHRIMRKSANSRKDSIGVQSAQENRRRTWIPSA